MEQIKGRTLTITSIIALAVIFVSCVTTQSLTIEIPQPSNKELPSYIQSLTLVNRTVDENYEDYHSDSLQNTFYKKRFNLDTVIYDLQAVDTTLKALGELLFESGRYDFVIPENRFLEFKKNSFLSFEMPWEEVKEICELYNTDAVLSIDHYKTNIETDYDRETFYNPSSDDFVEAFTAQMKINYEVLFRVYDTLEKRVILREFLRDTLIWEDIDVSSRDLFKRFTPVKQALAEAGIEIALDFSGQISTNWRREQRKLFSHGRSNFEQAGNHAAKGEWEPAISLWKEFAETSGTKSLKSKALYNIAVGYEILGDIDLSISWALESYNTMYRPLTYEYLEILRRRKNELKNLEK